MSETITPEGANKIKNLIRKAVERANLEVMKDRSMGYKLPQWLLRALAPPRHDWEGREDE